MAAVFNADGDYASIGSIANGALSDGGFTNFFTGGWYFRDSGVETYTTISEGSLVYMESAARNYSFGFDNSFSSGSAYDPLLTIIGDGFDVDFAATEQPPFNQWCWMAFTDVDDRTFGIWSPMASEMFHFRVVANAQVTSQYINTLYFGGNPSNVAGGYYAYWRARKGGIRDLATLRRLKRCMYPEASDFGFWPMEYDVRDYSGKGKNLTVTGSVTYKNDERLLSYLRGYQFPLAMLYQAAAGGVVIPVLQHQYRQRRVA